MQAQLSNVILQLKKPNLLRKEAFNGSWVNSKGPGGGKEVKLKSTKNLGRGAT